MGIIFDPLPHPWSNTALELAMADVDRSREIIRAATQTLDVYSTLKADLDRAFDSSTLNQIREIQAASAAQSAAIEAAVLMDSRALDQMRYLQAASLPDLASLDALGILDAMHRLDTVNLLDRAFLPASSIERWDGEPFPVLGNRGSTSSQPYASQSSHAETEAESDVEVLRRENRQLRRRLRRRVKQVKELAAERVMAELEASAGVILWINDEWSRHQIAELLREGDEPLESEDTDGPLD